MIVRMNRCHSWVVFYSSQFKERDLLEGIFKFWRSPDDTTFDIKKHWWVGVVSFCNHTLFTDIFSRREGRLRHYLGARYDSRSGVFDWDCQMKLKEMVRKVTISVRGVTYAFLVKTQIKSKWNQAIKVVFRRRSRDQDDIRATKINGSTIILRIEGGAWGYYRHPKLKSIKKVLN